MRLKRNDEDLISMEEEQPPEVLVNPNPPSCGYHHCRTGVRTVKIPIVSIQGGATWIKTVPIREHITGGFHAVGIAGYSVVSTSRLSVFRLRVRGDMLYIGIRNLFDKEISDKFIEIDLFVR